MRADLKVVRNKELVRWVSVTKNDLEAAFVEWDKNPHSWRTADTRQRAVRYNEKCYPPKEVARIAVELKERLPIGQLQRDGLTVEETKNVFERLGFKYIYVSKCEDTTRLPPRETIEKDKMITASNNELDSFRKAVGYIQNVFSELDFQPKIDWRFLYSPESTFSPTTKLMIFGQNPRRSEGDPFPPTFPRGSFEEGNAYRLERWGINPNRPNARRRQEQVVRLMEYIAERLQPKIDPKDLMDQTLTSNFCPFASPKWQNDLKTNEAVIKFSRELWSSIFTFLEPAVIICLGDDVFDEFKYIIATKFNITPTIHPTYYIGRFKHEIVTVGSSPNDIMILKIPVSGQDYRIMTNCTSKEKEERDNLIRKITARLNSIQAT